MYSQEFWKKVEVDRNEGMTVAEVCEKYHILPETLRNARYRGFLNDVKKLNASEAKEKRDEVSRMGPDSLSKLYLNHNSSLKRTLEFGLGMSNSKPNRDHLRSLLQSAGIDVVTKSRIGEITYTPDQFIAACAKTFSFTELAHELGLSVHTENNRKFKKLIQKYDIDISHWRANKDRRKYTSDEIFCANSKIPRTTLRNKVIQFNVLDLSKCSQCGTSEWLGQPLKIQIDHINGNSRDNRVENLRALCPNCHSLTETYGGNHRSNILPE